MTGKFIVIEGLEGAGKTTAIQTVSHFLNNQGIHDLIMTREPGGTPLAEQMRRLVKEGHPDESLTDMAELLLMYASRAQLVENVIRPALNKGQWVVGDRHDMSSQAYQGGGRGFDASTMLALRQMVLGDFRPNLTLYMDIDPNIGLARARGRGELDRIEKQAIEFFERTRHRFLSLAETEPNIVVIQANQSFEQVKTDIESALMTWLSKQ